MVMDFETFSEADLKKVGSWEYSCHPSTEILCAAWRIGTRATLPEAKTLFWAPQDNNADDSFVEFLDALCNINVILVAHNALFEQVITKNVFFPKYMASYVKRMEGKLEPERWLCTASLASAMAIPRKLELAAQVLKLPVQKDMEGHRLMLKWSKPRKPSKKNPNIRHSDSEEYERLINYCVTDIDAELGIFLSLPPLHPLERKVWEMDQRINLRGFQVDRPRVLKILDLIDTEVKNLNDETRTLTLGCVSSTTQRDRILDWLEGEGVYIPDLTSATVKNAIDGGLASGDALRMLQIRQSVSKSSTAKYIAFESRSRYDSRLRDNLIYHTASTGRWGGAGVQPQNFPRGNIKDIDQALQIIDQDVEEARFLYGDLMSLFSSCLRGMIVASPGKILDVADYAAIEARIVFWVADHDKGLEAYRQNRPMYEELATKIFNQELKNITKDQRFVGKQATLGCGFGMGPDKFGATCKMFGHDVSDELARTAVYTYRKENAPVAKLWGRLEKAAIAAIENPGKIFSINHTKWFIRGRFLYCQLPSGRRLAYCDPEIIHIKNKWGDKKPTIYHWGADAVTKKWTKQKTWGGTLTENVVQAIARDLMAAAMLRIEATGMWEIILSVHDELLGERDAKDFGSSNEEFCQLMAALPDWAEGMPVAVEGWSGKRYRK